MSASEVYEWGELVFAVLGLLATIARLTPNKRDDRWVGRLIRVIEAVGLQKPEGERRAPKE